MGYEKQWEERRGVHRNDEFDVSAKKAEDTYQEHLLKSWEGKKQQVDENQNSPFRIKIKQLSTQLSSKLARTKTNKTLVTQNAPKRTKEALQHRWLGPVVALSVLLFGVVATDNTGTTKPDSLGEVESLTDTISQNTSPTQTLADATTAAELLDKFNEAQIISESNSAYTAEDILNGEPVKINFQPLPAEFVDDENAIKKLALSLSDKTSISRLESDKGVLHLTTNEDGSQTAIFSYESFLYFITSDTNFSVNDWLNYINAL